MNIINPRNGAAVSHMRTLVQNIEIIYTEAQKDIADSVAAFLSEKAAGTFMPVYSAVIIVSDEATRDIEWQEQVRILRPGTRLVPAGSIIDADYNDPDVVPPSIEELNFIRIDEDLNDNIWDSINLDEDFYQIRNDVLVSMNSWTVSNESEAFLMNDYRKVKKAIRAIRRKKSTETEERSLQQLSAMEEYLARCRKYSGRIHRRTVLRRTFTVLLAIFTAVITRATVQMIRELRRASFESKLLVTERTDASVAEDFILLSDGLANYVINGVTRGAFYSAMMDCLEYNWVTTPTGLNYKYKLYDPHFLKDERYISTLTSNRQVLIWDTWRGRIDDVLSTAAEDLKLYYVDTENGVVTYVTGDNVIYFGDAETNQWLTNGVTYEFSGNTDIRALSAKDQLILYDDRNMYYFSLDPVIRLVSYTTESVMGDRAYEVQSVYLDDEGYTKTMLLDDGFYMETVKPDGTRKGASAPIRPKEGCMSVAGKDVAVFSDEGGNIVVMSMSKMEYWYQGLRLPDPKFLALLSDDILAYCDGDLGCHLYDLVSEADLGTVLTGFDDIEYFGCGDHTMICYSGGAYHCQDISRMLPLDEIDEGSALFVYDNTSPEDKGMVSSVVYTDERLLRMDLFRYTDQTTVGFAIDAGHVVYAGSSLSDPVVFGEGVLHYQNEPVKNAEDFTVVGITEDGYSMVFGTSDGQFREIAFEGDLKYRDDSYLQIPSHSAVVAIYEMEKCYYIKDADGRFWYADKLYPTHTQNNSLIFDLMNSKLRTHMGMSKEVMDLIRQQTIEDTSIFLMNGADGEEWE